MSGEDDKPAASIEVSLIDSIAKAELRGLVGDAAEVALDAVLNEGLLQAVPVVGTVERLYRTAVTIRDRLFLRKVVSFLNEFTNISQIDRQQFVMQLDEDAGTRHKAGAALALLLERLDDLDKPKIIGRLYRARLKDRLSFAELRRFCMIVERAHLPDLVALSRLPAGERVDSLAGPYLHALGLVSITGEDWGTLDGVGAEVWYEVNDIGGRFLSVAFSGGSS